MSFIKSLPETTNGEEDIINEVMQHFSDKNIPLTNLINIATNVAASHHWRSERFSYEERNLLLHTSFIPIVLSTDSIW